MLDNSESVAFAESKCPRVPEAVTRTRNIFLPSQRDQEDSIGKCGRAKVQVLMQVLLSFSFRPPQDSEKSDFPKGQWPLN